jgi:hypothetical protein
LSVTPYTLLFLAMPEMISVTPPVLVNVTVCAALVLPTAWLLKVSEVGLRDTTGETMPVPLKVTVAGLLAASELMTTLPLRAPSTVGEKLTLMLQLAPTASVLLQVVVWAKSPLATMLAMLSAATP